MVANHDRLRELFVAACDLAPPAQAAWLEAHCGDDPDTKRVLERLLREDDSEHGILAEDDLFAGIHIESDADGSLDPPVSIGRYAVKRLLGEGGMGVVWLAEQANPRRDVAVKVMRAGTMRRDLASRFELETAVLGRLAHPGIARIYEAGVYDDGTDARPFFAMEYVDGLSFLRFTRERLTDDRARLDLFARVCDAVHHAHQRGVVHRDLKPANIVVDAEGQPKVLDFGVARATDADLQVTTLGTDVGQLVGTLPYMSPEQIEGDPGRIDARSDVYALGVILYEMLAGRLPYDIREKSIARAARIISEDDPDPLASVSRAHRGDLDTIVHKALEKDPGRRYPSASHLAADVRRHLGHEPIGARPATMAYQLGKFARRHTGFVVGAAAAFVTLVVGIIATAIFAVGQSRALDEAERRGRIAEAVANFVSVDMIQLGNPNNEPDRDITLREVIERAAERIGDRFEGEPVVEGTIRNVLGETYSGLGEYDAALEQCLLAAELLERGKGPEEFETLVALNNVAALYRLTGRAQQAITIHERILPVQRRVLGERHESTLVTIHNLGAACWGAGQRDRAYELWVEAYEGRHAALGNAHPDTMTSIIQLGSCLRSRGELDEALRHFEEACRLTELHLPEEHPQRLEALAGLARVQRARRNYDEAVTLYLSVIEASRRVLGPTHPRTLSSVCDLGLVYHESRRPEEAETYCREAYDGSLATLGEAHPRTLHAMASLGMVLMARRRFDDAEPYLRRCLELHIDVSGDTHLHTLIAYDNFGGVLVALNRLDEAEPLLRRAVELRREVHGDDHRQTWRAEVRLLDLFRKARRYDDAEAWLLGIVDRREAAFGAASEHTRTVITRLVKYYEERGRDDDVARWRTRLAADGREGG